MVESSGDSRRAELSAAIRSAGGSIGFDTLRIAPAVSPPGFHPLLDWIASGYHADMDWIPRRRDAYEHPDGVMPGTRSIIVVGLNYYNDCRPNPTFNISRYAWGSADYHDLLRKRLKQLARIIRDAAPHEHTRAVVDTAPLLERDFARLAGIGWFGKNTMLISREIGSWFFLGAVLTTAELVYDDPFEGEFCGSCTACLDACPTNAFPKPGVLDANRCISYLTIERRDKSIPEELREGMLDWIFGCDICQDVCPWNRFAPDSSEEQFRIRDVLQQMTLSDLLAIDEQQFVALFRGTPLERTGRAAIVRNAAIVAANRRDRTAIPILEKLRSNSITLISEAANWALGQLTKLE